MKALDRRRFLKTIGAGATSLAMSRTAIGAERAKRRPNVIIIMTDDQGYGDLACIGNPLVRTPNLDVLHAESVRLTNYHVCPTCSPTRASLLTGRYSNRTGVWHTIMGRNLLRRDEITLGNVFSDAGYKTGMTGKWHLGDNYPFRPQDRGFQEVLCHRGGGIGNTQDYWGNDYFDDVYFRNGKPEQQKGYCTDVWFREALRFIEANRGGPFFCYLPTNAPHNPYRVPQRYKGIYRGQKSKLASFLGMITNIDENVGRLMRRLKELDLEDNTILIFSTDNGTSGGNSIYNAGMRGKKGSAYDGGHRTPCFIRWPSGGLVGGRDIDRLTAHIDIMPTLIELCGLKPSAGVKLDGVNLTPLLRGNGRDWPDRTLVVDSQRIDHPQKWRECAIMTDRWRLVNGTELYDMTADPGQRSSVAEEHPAVVKRLRAEYEKWWRDVSPRFGEYCEIILGADEENPTMLTSHDWHGTPVPWNQGRIRAGKPANGFWAVEVAVSGEYEIALRRWPREENQPIRANFVQASIAKLKIGEIELSQPVLAETTEVVFKADLEAGKTRLQTWFTDNQDKSSGAYYVYVKKL